MGQRPPDMACPISGPSTPWTPLCSPTTTVACPSRVAENNPKSEATSRLTLAAYLNLIATLHEHRHQLGHGMTARPWATWPAVGAWHIAGVVEGAEAATAIIEPEVWWAAVRAALRVLNTWNSGRGRGLARISRRPERPVAGLGSGGQSGPAAMGRRPGQPSSRGERRPGQLGSGRILVRPHTPAGPRR